MYDHTYIPRLVNIYCTHESKKYKTQMHGSHRPLLQLGWPAPSLKFGPSSVGSEKEVARNRPGALGSKFMVIKYVTKKKSKAITETCTSPYDPCMVHVGNKTVKN